MTGTVVEFKLAAGVLKTDGCCKSTDAMVMFSNAVNNRLEDLSLVQLFRQPYCGFICRRNFL